MLPEPDRCSRRKLLYFPVDRIWCRNVARSCIKRQRSPVYFTVHFRMSTEGFQLRSEHQSLASPAIVERFFAQPISNEEQCFVLPIPYSKGKHSVCTADGG